MANKWAIQNGNWSDGSTWNDGVVPTAADDVWLNGKTLTITFNEDVTISLNSLSNENNNDINVVEGGYVDITGSSSNPNNTFTFNVASNITVAARMFNYGSYQNPNQTIGVFNAENLIINKGYFCSNKSIVYQYNRLYINANIIVNDGYVCNAWAPIVIGDVTVNKGYAFQIGNENSTAKLSPSITGNCEVNDGYLLSSRYPGKVIIDGNVNINKGNFGSTHSYDKILSVNGNLYVSAIATIINSNNSYCGLEVNGELVSYSNSTYLITYLGNTYLNGPTRLLGTALLCNGYNANSTLYIHSDFHTGVLTKFKTGDPIPLVIFKDNGRLFYSQPNFFYVAQQMVVDNPEKFEVIYEGEGEPTFYIKSFSSIKDGMPQESDVREGVHYGTGIEKVGTYATNYPQEANVLKDVEYGDNQKGTLEVIALSGATAQAEDIAVVNLTEQQLQRVGNCATVSTVQKCFEEFKE